MSQTQVALTVTPPGYNGDEGGIQADGIGLGDCGVAEPEAPVRGRSWSEGRGPRSRRPSSDSAQGRNPESGLWSEMVDQEDDGAEADPQGMARGDEWPVGTVCSRSGSPAKGETRSLVRAPADSEETKEEVEGHVICRVGGLKTCTLGDIGGEGEWLGEPAGSTLVVQEVSTPPKLRDLRDPVDAAIRWRKWRNCFENYLVAMRVVEDSAKLRSLVRIGGDELERVIEELPQETADGRFEDVVRALNKYFDPFANPDRELVALRRVVQEKEESFNELFQRFKDLTGRCRGVDRVEEARIQLLVGCWSNKLRDMCLRQPGIETNEILALGRVVENESESGPRGRQARDESGQKEGPEVTGSAHYESVEAVRPSWETFGERKHGCMKCGRDWHPVIMCPARGRGVMSAEE